MAKQLKALYVPPFATEEYLAVPTPLASALLTFACQDDTRYHMCGLGVDCDGFHHWICATDGHTAIRVKIEDGPVRAGKPWDRDTVRAAIETAKIGGHPHEVRLFWTALQDVQFSPIRSVFPPAIGLKVMMVAVNSTYLARTCAIAEMFRRRFAEPGTVAIALRTAQGELAPVRIDVVVNSHVAVEMCIMPMNVTVIDAPSAAELEARAWTALAQNRRDAEAQAPVNAPVKVKRVRKVAA